jgi:hypothetical protein
LLSAPCYLACSWTPVLFFLITGSLITDYCFLLSSAISSLSTITFFQNSPFASWSAKLAK